MAMPSARRGFEKPASGHLSRDNGARADPYESIDGERSALGFHQDFRKIQQRIEAPPKQAMGNALAIAVQKRTSVA